VEKEFEEKDEKHLDHVVETPIYMLLERGSTPIGGYCIEVSEAGTGSLYVGMVVFLLALSYFINTRFRAKHEVLARHKEKHTMSEIVLGILLRQLWLYTKLPWLGCFLLQMSWTCRCSGFTGTRPRILMPPRSIVHSSGDTTPNESEGLKRRRRRQDNYQIDI
jgi:hypothetical protein